MKHRHFYLWLLLLLGCMTPSLSIAQSTAMPKVVKTDSVTCTPASGLAVYRLTHESAMLQWSSDGIAYLLKVSTTPITDFSTVGNVFNDTVYYYPYSLTGLSAQTTYYFYVQNICEDGSASEWVGSSFTTLCGAQTIPYEENFESYGDGTNAYPSCWTQIRRYGNWNGTLPLASDFPYCSSAQKYAGSEALLMNATYQYSSIYPEPNMTLAYAVLPLMNVPSLNGYQVSFRMYCANINSLLHIGVLTDPSDESTFEELTSIHASMSSAWQEFIIELDNTTNGSYIAFMVDASDRTESVSIYIDNVKVEEQPRCPKATGLYADNLNGTSCDLHWNGTADNWNVKVASYQINPLTTVGDIFNGQCTSNSINVTGLEAQTTYYYYIQADCDTNGLGEWSDMGTVSMNCLSISSFPYSENFDNEGGVGANYFPDCWTRNGNYYSQPMTSSSNAVSIPASVSMSAYGSTYSILVTPELNVDLRDMELTFNKNATTAKLVVGVMTDPNDLSTLVGVDTLSDNKTTANVRFLNYQGIGHYIAFMVDGSLGTSFASYYLDNITISYLPSCISPTTINQNNLTQNSVDLSWDVMLSESNWEVKISTRELSNPDKMNGDVLNQVVTTNALALDSLSPSMIYYGYIRSLCGDDTASWTPFNIITPCDNAISELPYSQDFESAASGSSLSLNTCLTSVGTNQMSLSGTNNHTINSLNKTSLYVYLYGTSNYSIASLPQISVPNKTISDMVLSFYARVGTANDGVIVGTMSDPTDATTFVPYDTIYITATGTFQEGVVDFSRYTGTDTYIALEVKAMASSYAMSYIDDIRLTLYSDCVTPKDMVVEDHSDTSIALSWTPRGNESQWQLAYGLEGFNPNDSSATILTVSEPYCTVNDLQANSTYDFYVRAYCAPSSSEWSLNPITTSTTKSIASLPYSTGFEDVAEYADWTLVNGNKYNQWYIGNAVSNSGYKSLYVTDDKGVSNHYTSGSSAYQSYVYAYRSLNLTDGNIVIDFDWRANGGSNDYLYAFLIPSSETLKEAGTTPLSSYLPTGNVPDGWIAVGSARNASNNWNHASEKILIEESGIYHLVFYWANYTSVADNRPAAVDNISVRALSCATPTLTEILPTDTVMVARWNSYNSATSWNVKVSSTPMTDMTATADAYDQTIQTDTVCVSGLASQSTYYFYLSSNCPDGNQSDWVEATFASTCAIESDMILEDFESVAIETRPDCWVFHSENTPYPYVSTEFASSGSRALKLQDSESYTILPATVQDIHNMQVSFSLVKEASNSGTFEIGVMSNPYDISSFEVVSSITLTTYKVINDYTVSFANTAMTGSNKYVAFHHKPSQSASAFWLDDVKVTEIGAYVPELDLYIDRLTNTGARLSWSSSENGIYNVKISSTPMNNMAATADVYDAEYLSDQYVILSGLTANTTYYCYVQELSTSGDSSLWSSEKSFTTLCPARTVPYIESFSSNGTGLNVLPDCWSTYGYRTGTIQNSDATPYCYEGVAIDGDNASLKMNGYYAQIIQNGVATTNSLKSFAVLPEFQDSLTQLQLQFSCYSQEAGNHVLVGVMTDPYDASTFVELDRFELGDWNTHVVNYSAYSGTTGMMAFCLDGELDRNNYMAYIDNVHVNFITSCMSPSSIETGNISGTTAELNWEPMFTADSLWHVIVSTTDLGGDLTGINQIASVVDTIVSTRPLRVEGLSPMTTYYVYIRTVCSSTEYSDYYPHSVAFTTGCGAINLPFYQGFDNTANRALPECWNNISNSTSTSYFPLVGASYKLGSVGKSVTFPMAYSTNTTMILPELNIDSIQRVTLSLFAYRIYNSKGVQVGVMTDPTDTTTFVALGDINTTVTSKWEAKTVSFSSYQGDGKYIALRIYSGYGGISLDNLAIEIASSCTRPGAPEVSNLTASSMTVAWEPGSMESQWEVVCIPAGTSVSDGSLLATNTSSLTITGLQNSTDYEVYVRAICDSVNKSGWAGPTSVQTKQTTASVPYLQDFSVDGENQRWTLLGGVQDNKWVIGGAAPYVGNQSLYISDDEGASNHYNLTGVCSNNSYNAYDFAYRTIEFPVGENTISFAWKCSGDGSYDFARAFLIPESYVFLPETNNGVTSSTTVPVGWIEIGELMNGQSSWTTTSYTLRLNEPVTYHLAFYWSNNSTYGYQSPAAIDDIKVITEDCYSPILKGVTGLTTSTAQLNWIVGSDSSKVVVSTMELNADAIDTVDNAIAKTIVAGSSYVLSGLISDTEYYYYVRGICEDSETDWESGSFTTPCEANNDFPFTETFAAREFPPMCWTMQRTTQVGTTSLGWERGVEGHDDRGVAALQKTTSGNVTELVTPLMNIPTANGYKVRFWVNRTTGLNSDVEGVNVYCNNYPYAQGGTLLTFVPRYYQSEPAATQGWNEYEAIIPESGELYIIFEGVTDNKNIVYLDDITIETLAACVEPSKLTVRNITETSAVLSWYTPSDCSSWRVLVSEKEMVPSSDNNVYIDTVIALKQIQFNNLKPSEDYYCYVQSLCSNDTTSIWSSELHFETECGQQSLPITEDFSNSDFLPACWESYSALLDNVINNDEPLLLTGSSWIQLQNQNLSNTASFLMGRYVMNGWMAIPKFAVESSAVLEFDAALCIYTASTSAVDMTADTNYDDEKFMVVVSRDGGDTWLAEDVVTWAADGTGDYNYKELTPAAKHYTIDLSKYVNDTVKLAFYAESTVALGSVTQFMIDNINIHEVEVKNVSDAICQGTTAYQGNGFDLNTQSLMVEDAPYLYSQMVGDTMVRLTLDVLEPASYLINRTICQGDTLRQDGFVESVAGDYNQYFTAANGCDSIVTLRLQVNPTYNETESLSLMDNELPYQWNGFTLTGDGVYTYNGQTVAGCDSTVVLTLSVTPVGLTVVSSDAMMVVPNPVKVNNEAVVDGILTEEEQKGLVVEVYQSSGALVRRFSPENYPIELGSFPLAGLYTVRVVLGTGEVKVCKFIVY